MWTATEILVLLWIVFVSMIFARRWKQQQHIRECLSRFTRLGYSLPWFGDAWRFIGRPSTLLQWGCDTLKEKGPNIAFWMFGIPGALISRPADIEIILSNTKNINKPLFFYQVVEGVTGRGLLTLVGDEWRRHRKAIAPSFNISVLETYVDIFVERAEGLCEELARFSGGSDFDVFPLVGLCSTETIYETVLGSSVNDISREERLEFVDSILTATDISMNRLYHTWYMFDAVFALSPQARRLKAASAKIDKVVGGIVQGRKDTLAEIAVSGKNADDNEDVGMRKRYSFLDLMLTTSTLSSTELVNEVKTLFGAQETSIVLICYVLQMLAMHSEIQEEAFSEVSRVWADPDLSTFQRLQSLPYLDRVIKETLRLFPSVGVNGVNVESDSQLSDGTVMPAGSIAAFFIFGIHRDPNNFPDPLRFDPDLFLPENCSSRHPYAFIPFSAGPRICIGYKYAQLQVKALLSTILLRYQILAAEGGPKNVSDYRLWVGIVLKSYDGYKIRLKNRSL